VHSFKENRAMPAPALKLPLIKPWPASALPPLLALVMAWPVLAGASARVGTEAQIDARGTHRINAAHNECYGCLASTSSTGTVADAAVGTSQSDSCATALADYGVLKVFAETRSSGLYGSARASALADFSDGLSINAPGLAGQRGTVNFALQFNHAANFAAEPALAGAYVALNLDVEVGLRTLHWQRGLLLAAGTPAQSVSFDPPANTRAPFSGSLLASADFTFGEPFSFTARLTAMANGSHQHQATLDASHSAYWGGIQSVLGADGNTVIYSLASDSNTDWSRSFVPSAVPEMSSAALLLAGLASVGALTRRRR
jgi:hypothetical protein